MMVMREELETKRREFDEYHAHHDAFLRHDEEHTHLEEEVVILKAALA